MPRTYRAPRRYQTRHPLLFIFFLCLVLIAVFFALHFYEFLTIAYVWRVSPEAPLSFKDICPTLVGTEYLQSKDPQNDVSPQLEPGLKFQNAGLLFHYLVMTAIQLLRCMRRTFQWTNGKYPRFHISQQNGARMVLQGQGS